MSCQCQPVASGIGAIARMCLIPTRPPVAAASPRSRYSMSARGPSRVNVASRASHSANADIARARSSGPSYRAGASWDMALVFHGYRVERAPEVPGRHAAVGTPALAEALERAPRAATPGEIMQRNAFLQADVIQREDVRAQLVEDQEHLGGPAPDPFHVDERGDERFVVERRPPRRVEGAGDE